MSSSQHSSNDAEIDLNAESWKLPYSIEDEDLQFDGKPLNLLYEENRWLAERDRQKRGMGEEGSHQRGRTMHKKSKH